MYTVETKQGKKKHQVTFYDSDRVLTYRRWHKFNKHCAVQAEVGSDLNDYDRRTARTIMYLNSDDKDSAITELTNQRQCFFNIIQEYSPKGMALAVLVHSIDGEVYTDFEETALDKILDKLDAVGFTFEMLNNTVDHLKKK
jgi:hypothetical protein